MPSFCTVVVCGNLTRDVELRHTPKGIAVGDFALAVNRKWKGEDGQLNEEVSFIDVTAYSNRAETLAQYVRKGDGLLVQGRLKQDTWEDKATGSKRAKLKVILETFMFMGGKEKGGGEEPAGRTRTVKPDKAPSDHAPDEDDDVPF